MMYSKRLWACPFFRWDEREQIHCEGGVVSFPDRESCAGYAGKYCGSVQGWKDCTIAKSMADYYERTESDG